MEAHHFEKLKHLSKFSSILTSKPISPPLSLKNIHVPVIASSITVAHLILFYMNLYWIAKLSDLFCLCMNVCWIVWVLNLNLHVELFVMIVDLVMVLDVTILRFWITILLQVMTFCFDRILWSMLRFSRATIYDLPSSPNLNYVFHKIDLDTNHKLSYVKNKCFPFG